MPKILLPPLLAGLLAACGSATPAAPALDCPNDQQAGCPSTALGYDTGVGALLSERCSPCHAEGGIEATRLLTDYSHASGLKMSIGLQLQTCAMPPFGAPPLTISERQQILDWLTCGARR